MVSNELKNGKKSMVSAPRNAGNQS